MGSQPVEFDEFAACLRALKERAGLSYEALAGKTGISGSSLHRYCSGSYVPQDYGSAHRFATACGASPEELRRLHRLWALADAARDPGRGTDTERGRGRGRDGRGDGRRAGRAADGGVNGGGNGGVNRGVDQDVAQDGPHGSAPALDPALDSDPAAAVPAPAPAPAVPAAVPTPRPPWHRRRSSALVVVVLALALGATAWGLTAGSGGGSPDDEDRPLFSAACAGPVTMGQRGACVREVQRLLARAGAELDVDGEFGPQTLRRVTAFQVLSGVGVTGVVGDKTKKALYASKTRMDTWSPEKVRLRIREVFGEVPDRAVAIADCQSFLDPLHILPNTDTTRNWGVFQISDATLRRLGGTPRDALDPEWNIQAAHRLWSRARNFGDWPNCDRAASPVSTAPTASSTATGPALVQAADSQPVTRPPDTPASSASSAPTAANCPAPGQRFKTAATHDRVYLVGPGSRLYYIPDATVYFNLWDDDYRGVVTVSGGVFADCGWDEARELADAFIARTSSSLRAYIWDAWYGYRWIADQTVFDTYGFSQAKIQIRSSLSPINGDTRWQ
ncbi:helix-turn-helix domain-containing protein [Streptomyces sp. GQFP]|uniref:helix-turn-helix domain-containing protein n=1 Tax=Streptomyces sp. GQFP TaxID=2907545 RepID=UPI001F219E77|nr:helix-turn-helix domain-containing protein [Streptomyces sp. GQFP]UIX32331.1 helix-turn-helix domain-containing protein [Streptomyces sp. GQFP]